MARQHTFETGEWYHLFNRGVEKRIVFEDERDANRFLMIMYLANGTEPISLFNIHRPELQRVFKEERGEPIVSIGAYCLMPNHFHLLVKEVVDWGISSYMRKVGTAYAMYFNAKNKRVGNLFMKPFRSRHVSDDHYFQKVLEYIHCNPAELYEPSWKSGKAGNISALEKKITRYPYSSLKSYCEDKVTNPILSQDGFEIANQLPLSRMLKDAQAYYSEIAKEPFLG